MASPRVLLVGEGGREHTLAHCLVNSDCKPSVIAAPGNPGIDAIGECVPVGASDVDGLVKLADERAVDLVVVGPEAPLVAGLADRLRADGVAVVGPNAAAANLEGSKTFAKQIMDEGGVPTARWIATDDREAAVAFARELDGRVAVKADGLAGGKGVVVADDVAAAQSAIDQLVGGDGGDSASSRSAVIEERLEGEELSVIALADGSRVALLLPSQDHKRVGEGDVGPNTGGMGAYAPAPRGTPALLEQLQATCIEPVLDVLAARGAPFTGVLYAGVMLTNDGPRVLEYNVRFGDPEAQVILPLLADDAYEVLSATARGELPEAPLGLSPRAALTVVLASEGYPAAPNKGARIEGLAAAQAHSDVLVFQAGTRRQDGALVTSGGRVLAVTGLGDDLSTARDRAYAAVAEISWPGMHYRRDIGHRALPTRET